MNNFVEKIENRVKGLHKSRLINPHKHWVVLIQIFLLITFVLIIFGFYLLYKIRGEQIFQVVPSSHKTPPSLIKKILQENVNEAFMEKEMRSKKIKAGLILFSDPS